MRRPDPLELEAAFLALLVYVPMGYYAVRLALAWIGI
jgi:hypothetical protein